MKAIFPFVEILDNSTESLNGAFRTAQVSINVKNSLIILRFFLAFCRREEGGGVTVG